MLVAAPPAGGAGENDHASDLGGRAVERAAAPDTPALEPIEAFGKAPRPRSATVRVAGFDLAPRMNRLPPKPLSTEIVTIRPAPPPERVPPDLGAGSRTVPAKPKLPVAAEPTKRARDVNLPPPLPALGRRAADRVGFDDPTMDYGNAAITRPPVKTPYSKAPFLKLGIPDPFELAEQIRPMIPPNAEPGRTPVPVNPRRVKGG